MVKRMHFKSLSVMHWKWTFFRKGKKECDDMECTKHRFTWLSFFDVYNEGGVQCGLDKNVL